MLSCIAVDAKSAGEGQIVAEVRSLTSGVPSDLVPTATKKIYLLSFLPKESGEHTVTVTFNDEPVPRKCICGYGFIQFIAVVSSISSRQIKLPTIGNRDFRYTSCIVS